MYKSFWWQYFLLIVLFLLQVYGEYSKEYERTNHHEKNIEVATTNDKSGSDLTELRMFEQLFKAKRMEQATAIQTIRAMKDPNKEKATIKLLLKNMRQVLMESRDVLQTFSKQQISLIDLLKNDSLKDHASKLLENTAFFGEFALFFPDIVEKILSKDEEYKLLYAWSYEFFMRFTVNTETRKMLMLSGQELGLVARDDNYTNPYRAGAQKEAIIRTAMAQMEKIRAEKRSSVANDAKHKRHKGPRISQGEL